MAFNCVIFDWDGTIMDTVPKIVNTLHLAAKEYDLPPVSDEQAKSIIGLSLPIAINTLYPNKPALLMPLIDAYKRIYREVDTTPTPLFEGVKVLLEALKAKGIKLAVATGKSRAGLDRLLEESGLAGYFDFTITADEAESKPHPDMILQTLHALDADAAHTVMVGDTVIDMTLAHNAQVSAIAVTLGASSAKALRETHALSVVDSYSELEHVLLS